MMRTISVSLSASRAGTKNTRPSVAGPGFGKRKAASGKCRARKRCGNEVKLHDPMHQFRAAQPTRSGNASNWSISNSCRPE